VLRVVLLLGEVFFFMTARRLLYCDGSSICRLETVIRGVDACDALGRSVPSF
jgi:hypothetical protein